MNIKEAKEKLTEAQTQYHAVIAAGRKQMSPEQANEHREKCRKALGEKRYAAAVLEALQYNRPVPEPENLPECEGMAATRLSSSKSEHKSTKTKKF